MLHNLLIYRLVIVNAVGFALLTAAWLDGIAGALVAGDVTHSALIYLIAAVFLVGLASVFIRAAKVSGAMNAIKAGRSVSLNAAKFIEKNAHVEDVCTWLVTLSLLGNVIGFAIAVGGHHDLSSSEGLLALASQFMGGMMVAFYTTITGLVFAMWLDINRRILKTATVLMLEDAGVQ